MTTEMVYAINTATNALAYAMDMNRDYLRLNVSTHVEGVLAKQEESYKLLTAWLKEHAL